MSAAEEIVQTEIAATEEAKDTGPRMAKKVIGIQKDADLTVLAESNPKRPGSASFDRFEGYLADPAPTTVQEALDGGLTMGDIKYDVQHGSIDVEGAEIVEYEVTERGPRTPKEDGEETENDLDGTDNDLESSGEDPFGDA